MVNKLLDVPALMSELELMAERMRQIREQIDRARAPRTVRPVLVLIQGGAR